MEDDAGSNGSVVEATVESYRVIPGLDIFAIGIFDESVTVLSQQARALNLAWALAESGRLRPGSKIAIVGAGFAGLTFSAGLISKDIDSEITILERLDSVLPMQQGTDSRWLHPHIYDWPAAGSQASSATLPILNWTAGRASDVAVQVQEAWQQLVTDQNPQLRLFCNTARTRISRDDDRLFIEWMGHERSAPQPANAVGDDAQKGRRESFDLVILAAGFGVEKGGGISYWRNETLAQPALDRQTTAHVISGHGDGGWIDLFRLRIMNFRQDRILGELFSGIDDFVDSLRAAKKEVQEGESAIGKIEALWKEHHQVANQVEDRMRERLRHDTSVTLNLRQDRGFKELFDRRVSFQNQLLAWVLFRVGAFDIRLEPRPKTGGSRKASHANLIVRHGTDRFPHLASMLSDDLRAEIIDGKGEKQAEEKLRVRCKQSDQVMWDAGYFDRPLGQDEPLQRAHRNREYLPPITRLLAATICGGVAGYLVSRGHAPHERLRVALHRAIPVGKKTYLQQCCDYQGIALDDGDSTAARTYSTTDLAIGQAFSTRRVVRNAAGATADALKAEMTDELEQAKRSRPMSDGVNSMLAIPVLSSDTGTVVCVIFADSFQTGIFDDGAVSDLAHVIEKQLGGALRELESTTHALLNIEYWSEDSSELTPPAELSLKTLETVEISPPSVATDRLNVDMSSFVKVGV